MAKFDWKRLEDEDTFVHCKNEKQFNKLKEAYIAEGYRAPLIDWDVSHPYMNLKGNRRISYFYGRGMKYTLLTYQEAKLPKIPEITLDDLARKVVDYIKEAGYIDTLNDKGTPVGTVKEAEKEITLEYGDLLEWCHPWIRTHEGIILNTFDGLVSITYPGEAWSFTQERLIEKIRAGEIRKLPVGTQVTLTQK